MSTFQNLYLEIRDMFRMAGLPGAELEARELVCCGGGMSRGEFYRSGAVEAGPEVEASVRALAGRHLAGEPVAYLIGEWEFYGLTLDVDASVLIPRADTEVLAEAVIAYVRSAEHCRVLDLCAGSGCVGLAVAANAPGCRTLLGEWDENALRVCRRNVRRCALEARAETARVDALAQPPRGIGEFGCIACNPPYIPQADMETLDLSVRGFEPRIALCGGADGLDFYRAIVTNWRPALAEHGRLYFEVGIGQADAVARLMLAAGFDDINIIPDTRGISRVVYGTVRRTARPSGIRRL